MLSAHFLYEPFLCPVIKPKGLEERRTNMALSNFSRIPSLHISKGAAFQRNLDGVYLSNSWVELKSTGPCIWRRVEAAAGSQCRLLCICSRLRVARCCSLMWRVQGRDPSRIRSEHPRRWPAVVHTFTPLPRIQPSKASLHPTDANQNTIHILQTECIQVVWFSEYHPKWSNLGLIAVYIFIGIFPQKIGIK